MKTGRIMHYVKMGLIGVTAGGTGALLTHYELSAKQKADDCKMEILTKNPQRFLKLSKSVLENNGVDWTHESEVMNDSLRKDSMIHKAYFEGAQMVCASIANVNKE